MLTKKRLFVPSLCAAISKTQPLLLKVDLPCTTTNLTIDTRATRLSSEPYERSERYATTRYQDGNETLNVFVLLLSH